MGEGGADGVGEGIEMEEAVRVAIAVEVKVGERREEEGSRWDGGGGVGVEPGERKLSKMGEVCTEETRKYGGAVGVICYDDREGVQSGCGKGDKTG